MKRIATPMVGGVVTSFVLELLLYPVIFTVWRGWRLAHRNANTPPTATVYSRAAPPS
jgi:Cu(I)/Ag(I) efflux system membrane protein CusA/SilA